MAGEIAKPTACIDTGVTDADCDVMISRLAFGNKEARVAIRDVVLDFFISPRLASPGWNNIKLGSTIVAVRIINHLVCFLI
jgi:hypothetical protein